MSIPLIVDANSYQYPAQGDKANTGWGGQATSWASAVTAALTKLGLGGTLSPIANAVINIDSTSKGILIPRMTTAQRDAIISPTNSLLIFNTTLKVVQYYDSSVSTWISIGARLPDNAVFSGTLQVNGNITGLGSLTLSGGLQATTGDFTSKILTGDGTVSAPSNSFISEVGSGLYKIATNKLGIAINGGRVGEVGVGYGGFTGNVIQVVQNQYSTQIIRNSGLADTYISTGLSCSIIPKYNNSKILISYTIGGNGSTNGAISGKFKLYKNLVELPGNFESVQNYNNSAQESWSSYHNEFLDSPATTNSITYEVYFARASTGGSYYVQYSSANSTMILMEVQQ